MASLGDLIVKVGSDITGFNSGMEKVSTALTRIDNEVHSKFAGFSTLGSHLGNLGAGLSAAFTLPMAAISTVSTRAFGDFQSALNRASALGDIFGQDLNALKEAALDLGAKTQFSATQAAGGMAELAAAGFNTNQILAAMPGVLDLAAAGQVSVGQASEIAANIMGGFGISAEGVGHAVNVMAKAAASGSLGINDLAYTMKYVGPVATSAGLSFEEVTAATTLLSNAGIKGEQAGTGLRGAIASLISPSKKAAEALADLGVKTTDSSGKLRPLNQIFMDLKAAGATTADVFTIFGRETASAAQKLIDFSGKPMADMTASLVNSEGAAAKMAKTINGGLDGAMERMKGSVETAGIKLGEVLEPAIITAAGWLETAANKVGDLITWFGKLPTPIQSGVFALGGMAAAAGPLALGLGGISSAIGTIGPAIAPLAAALGVGTGAFGAIALGVVALSAATVALYEWWRKAPEEAAAWAPAILLVTGPIGLVIETMAALAAWVTNNWAPIVAVVKQSWEGIHELWTAYWDTMIKGLKYDWGLIKSGAEAIWNPIRNFFTTIWDGIGPYMTGVWSVIRTALTPVWNAIASSAATVWGGIVSVFQTFLEWAGKIPGVNKLMNLDEAWNAAKKLEEQTKKTTEAVKGHAGAHKDAKSPVDKMKTALDQLKTGLTNTHTEHGNYTQKLRDHEEPARKFDAALLNHLTKLRELSAHLQGAIREQAAWTLAYVNGVGPMHDMAKALDGVKVSLSSVVPELKTVQGVIGEVSQDVGEAGDDYDGMAKKVKIACADSKGDLEDFGRANKSVWSQIKDDISQAVDAFSGKIGQTFTDLLTGEFSLKKVTDAFRDLGLSIIDSLMEKGAKAITNFVTEHIGTLLSALTKVLEKIPLIGEAISGALGGLGGILGGAGKAAGTAAGTATQTAGNIGGGAATGAAGAAGKAISGALGAALGWAQLGTSLVDTVFGIFQRARQENTLNAIEENTRYTKGFTYALVEGAIEYWPKITDIWSYLWNTQLTALNTLTVGLETVHDWLRSIDTYLTHIWRDTGDIARNTIATFEFLRDEIATRLGSKAEESTGAEVRIADNGEIAASLSDLAGILRDGFARVVDALAAAKQQIVNVEYRPVGNIGLDAAAQLSTANNTLSGISAILSRATGILNPNVAVTAVSGEAQTLLQALGKLGGTVADGFKTLSLRLVQEAAEGFSDLSSAVMEGARATVAELAYTNQLLAAGAGTRNVTVNVYAQGATTEIADQIATLVTRRLAQELR